MGNTIDLIGQRFGRLVVVKYVEKYKYLCQCDCGNIKSIYRYSFENGDTKSCGCLAKEMLIERSITHGHKKGSKPSKIYKSWESMIRRCTNPSDNNYHRYGNRGITVCERWLNSFENFLEDMGEIPSGCQIDRINNNKGYCKSNCRWATRKQQARNRHSNNLKTYNGKTQCIAAWAEETGIHRGTIMKRLKLGWSMKDALIIPVGKRIK